MGLMLDLGMNQGSAINGEVMRQQSKGTQFSNAGVVDAIGSIYSMVTIITNRT
jgi:hypothetical protein